MANPGQGVNKHGIKLLGAEACRTKAKYKTAKAAEHVARRSGMRNTFPYLCKYCKLKDGSPSVHLGRDVSCDRTFDPGHTLAEQMKHKVVRGGREYGED